MRDYLLALLTVDSACHPLPDYHRLVVGDRIVVIQNPYNVASRHCAVLLPKDKPRALYQRNPSTNSPWEDYVAGTHATENKPCPIQQFIDVDCKDPEGKYLTIERLDTDQWFKELDTVTTSCYHNCPFLDDSDEENPSPWADGDRDIVKQWGALEVYRIHVPRHGSYIVVLRNHEPDEDESEVSDYRCQWLYFSENRDEEHDERCTEIDIQSIGTWASMRTVFVEWSEVYDHEDGFNQTILGTKIPEAILVLRGSLRHPLR